MDEYMITIEVNQTIIPDGERLKEALILSIAKNISELAPSAPEGEISLSFVSDEKIQRLNRMYRDKDEVTDVLSFSDYVNNPGTPNLGDVAISYDQAKRQSNNGDVELEVVDLIVHGILHVLGYDHEKPEDAKEMFPLQDKIVGNVL